MKANNINVNITFTNNKDNKMTNKETVEKLRELASKNAEMAEMINGLIDQIDEGGCIEVEGIVRRWLPSQCLRMLDCEYATNGNMTFHKQLVNRGYNYSWKVLLDELKRQEKMMRNGDVEEFFNRNVFYNRNLAYRMAQNYVSALIKHISQLKKHSHEGRQYVKLSCHLNNGNGLYVDQILNFLSGINEACNDLASMNITDTKNVYKYAKIFNERIKLIKFEPDMDMEFINAYKASGAYYTMKDLIMFEGCRVVPLYSRGSNCSFEGHDEVSALEYLNDEIEHELTSCDGGLDVMHKGYRLMGMLKAFIEENGVNISEMRANWGKQSEERRALRMANRSNRRVNQ